MTEKSPPVLTHHTQMLIRRKMFAACQQIAKECGLVLQDRSRIKNAIDLSFDVAFRVSICDSDGNAFNPEKERFGLIATAYGLSPSDYGRIFETRGEQFRIVGIEPRRHKYPISVERVSDSQRFKFATENVKMFLSKADR